MSKFPWLGSMACSYPGSMADQELLPWLLSKIYSCTKAARRHL